MRKVTRSINLVTYRVRAISDDMACEAFDIPVAEPPINRAPLERILKDKLAELTADRETGFKLFDYQEYNMEEIRVTMDVQKFYDLGEKER